MAGVAASVARGRRVVPHLLQDTTAADGGVTRPLTPEEAGMLSSMMRAVVTEGTATFLDDLPGPAVAAKTGTAEYEHDGTRGTHA
jgi:cell division protein FtsI/penicillin-binding protein 2